MQKQNRFYFFCAFALALLSLKASAQQAGNDLQLVQSAKFYTDSDFNYYHGAENDQQVFKTHHRSVVAAYNPVALVFKSSMLLYQNVISPQLSRECAYDITCSNFTKQSIKEFGLVKGIFIGSDRIMRCNRLSLVNVNLADINPATGKLMDAPSRYK